MSHGVSGAFYNASNYNKGICPEAQLSKEADSMWWVKVYSLMVCIMEHLMWHINPQALGNS